MATLAQSLSAPSQDYPVDQDTFQEQAQDKISAYYSLVFPNFTYYIQTLKVIIGRRCIPSSTPSSSEVPQVDVDLGSLKSVSRLHAKIEYEEEEERFMLHVMGRNGAWVDGVWSGSGSKVPLGDRSQIQIASRTFHFVLPPPPAPEDSPSPSSHSSTGNRARSPSVDITSIDVTSISPPSSIPSCSPPPVLVPPKIPPHLSVQPQLPNSNSIPRPKSNPKKRKKAEIEPQPLPKPDVLPPKPPYTYAQLCYRAIKGLSGRGSLQDICQWIQDNFEYYKYSDKDWESSVRHNLSSNRAFKKVERGPYEKGKGALWTLDPVHEHSFEEAERKQALAALGAIGGKDGKAPSKKGKAPPLDPPLKRSVKGENKNAPLPPPLTSAPLIPKSAIKATPVHPPALAVKTEPIAAALDPFSQPSNSTTESSTPIPSPDPQPSASTSSTPLNTSFPAIPVSVRLPIIVGMVPNTASISTTGLASPPKPISLHENTLYLNPEIFSHLMPKQLQDLEALGAQKALEILQSYIVRYYKEKLKAEGARGRGRGRTKRGRGNAPGPSGRGSAPGASREGSTSDLFTTTPLPPRPSLPPQPGPSSVPAGAPMAPLEPMVEDPADDPVIVVDDDSPDETPPAKRQRTETPAQ